MHDWISRGNGCEDEAIDYTGKEDSYTDILSSHGYYCAMSGKYHLGDQQHPQHSFKHWFVHQKGGSSYINPPMVNNSKCENIKGYVTDIITDDAIKFINGYTESGMKDPFYISVHYTSPHAPYVGADGKAESMHPKQYVDMYNDSKFISCPQEAMSPYARHFSEGLTEHCLGNRECLKGYYAAVTAMDMNIGKILDTLHSNGLDQSTLVVFASDHGFNAGHHGLWGKGNAAYPLNMFDTSIRIPMIWRHLGAIKPAVENSVVQVLDVAPTLIEYAVNTSFPSIRNIPGESFSGLLTDPSSRDSKMSRIIFGEYGQTRYARSNATDGMKYVMRLTGHAELYDLENDKMEKLNLLSPFSGIKEKVNSIGMEYDRALREWFSFYEDPYVSGWAKPVTGTGQRRALYYNTSGWPNTPEFDQL